MTTTASDELISALGETQEETSLEEIFGEITPRLQHRLEQKEAAWTEIEQLYNARRATHLAEVDRMKKVLKELGAAPKRQRQRIKPTAGGEPKPSPESVEKVVRWLADQDEPKSFKEIGEGLGISSSSATKQANVARGLELIMFKKNGGKTGRELYFGVSDDALTRLDEGSVQWP